MSDDWSIDNASHLKGIRFQRLKGIRFQRRRYRAPSESWDHDHCAACWAKFAEFDGPDIQHEGYTTCDDYRHGAEYDWVCVQCFSDLRDVMGWTLASLDNSVK